MQKSFFLFYFLVTSLLTINGVYADAIPDDSRSIEYCIKIGVNEIMRNMYVVGVDEDIYSHSTFLVKPNTCISGNSFYWIQKDEFEQMFQSTYSTPLNFSYGMQVSDLILAKVIKKNQKILGTIPRHPTKGYVNERDPLLSEQYVYTIEKTGTGYVFLQDSYTPTYSRAYVIKNFFSQLGITILVETCVLWVGIYGIFRRKDIKKVSTILAGVLVSALTLPVFWYLLPFGSERILPVIFLYEGIIILVEMSMYSFFFHMKPYQLFLLSLIANIASILAGKML